MSREQFGCVAHQANRIRNDDTQSNVVTISCHPHPRVLIRYGMLPHGSGAKERRLHHWATICRSGRAYSRIRGEADRGPVRFNIPSELLTLKKRPSIKHNLKPDKVFQANLYKFRLFRFIARPPDALSHSHIDILYVSDY